MKAITRTELTPVLYYKKDGVEMSRVLSGMTMASAKSMFPLMEGEDKVLVEKYVKYSIKAEQFYDSAEVIEIIEVESYKNERKMKENGKQ